MSDAGYRPRVKRPTDPALLLRPEEKRLAYGLTVLAGFAFLLVWQPWKGGDRLTGAALSLLFPASMALVVRQGHRLWTAFAAFLLGIFGPWGNAFIFGAAYIAFAFWLGWKAHRSVKASVNADMTTILGKATPLPEKKKPAIESGRVTPKGTARRRSPKRS